MSILLAAGFRYHIARNSKGSALAATGRFFAALVTCVFTRGLTRPYFFPFGDDPHLFYAFAGNLIGPKRQRVLATYFCRLPNVLVAEAYVRNLPRVIRHSSLLLWVVVDVNCTRVPTVIPLRVIFVKFRWNGKFLGGIPINEFNRVIVDANRFAVRLQDTLID